MNQLPNKITFKDNIFSPSKVVCVGRNYADHIAELGNVASDSPVIFVKPNSAISSELKSQENTLIHYETEISYLIQGNKFIGIGLGLDLTKRTLQTALKSKGLPWERAKSFDGSAVFSDFLPIPDPNALVSLELWIDGELKQKGDESLMLHKPFDLIKEVQDFMSLVDYDILMTGTPSGVAEIRKGQTFVAKLFADKSLLIEQTWVVQ